MNRTVLKLGDVGLFPQLVGMVRIRIRQVSLGYPVPGMHNGGLNPRGPSTLR